MSCLLSERYQKMVYQLDQIKLEESRRDSKEKEMNILLTSILCIVLLVFAIFLFSFMGEYGCNWKKFWNQF